MEPGYQGRISTTDILETIVRQVADCRGKEMCDVAPPVSEAVELEAATRLVNRWRECGTEGSIEFSYADHEVVIGPSGVIAVACEQCTQAKPRQD